MLVQLPSIDDVDLDTAFWMGVVVSVILTAILLLGAWPLSEALGQPELRIVLQVLSCTLIFVAIGSTHQAVLERDLNYRQLATATVTSNFVATAVGIVFAIVGLGVWALVVQTVLAIAINAVLLASRSGYHPGLAVSVSRARQLSGRSVHVVGAASAALAIGSADNLLIGAVLGPEQLGIYTVAYRLVTVMLEVLSTSARIVALPVFARIQHQRDRLGRAYLSAMRLCSMLVAPSFIFCFVEAPLVIGVLFGDKWLPGAPVLQVLCAYGLLQGLMQFNQALLQSIGRMRLVFGLLTSVAVLQVAGFAIAVAVSHSIVWVAASLTIVSYLTAPVDLVVAMRELDLRLNAYVATLGPSLSAAAVMGLVCWLLGIAMGSSWSDPLRLIFLSACAVPSYFASLWLVGRTQLAEAIELVRTVVRQKAKVGPSDDRPAGS